MNDILVAITARPTTPDKLHMLMDMVHDVKRANLPVLYATNTGDYLEEIAKHVEYISYDSNNLLATSEDYLDNIDLLSENPFQFGFTYYHNNSNQFDIFETSVAPYSAAVTILFKNASHIAIQNNFKWVVFMNYDTPIPTDGFYKLIFDKIQYLKDNDKNCFAYNHLLGISHQFFIYQPHMIKDSLVMNEDYKKLSREWIRFWKFGSFESIMKHTFQTYFNDTLVWGDIDSDSNRYWNLGSSSQLNRVNSTDEFKLIYVSILPSKVDDVYSLFLYITALNTNLIISNLKITNKRTNSVIYTNNNININQRVWHLNALSKDFYNLNDELVLEYEIIYPFKKFYKKTYNLKYIDTLYTISNIKFK